jgi:hypothetical protein
MSQRRIYILYEDQRGPTTQFGPHELLMSCVADALDVPRRDLRDRLRAIPLKGDSNLLANCHRRTAAIAPRGEPVVALFDDDKIRRLLKLPASTSKQDVAMNVLTQSRAEWQLVVWLLQDNIDTLVEAAASCIGRPPGAKSPTARDRILLSIAWGPREQRDGLGRLVPSFACFVKGVSRLCGCA